jgi:hypothetical protein
MKILLIFFSLLSLLSCRNKTESSVTEKNKDSIITTVIVPDEAIVQEVKPIQEKIDFTNSPFLIIRLLQNKYQIYYHQDSLITSNIKEIDKFISQRIRDLNKEKTLLIGERDGSLKNFKDLKIVLKKYEIYKFRIKTAEEEY